MSIKASRRFYGIGLAFLAVGGFAACSSDDPVTGNGNTAGTAGTATGGTSSGGTSSGGTSTAGSSTAGSSTAGTSTAGSGGAGGGSGQACAATKPASNLITSFGDLVASTSTTGQFTFMAGVPGGTFTYAVAAIKAADTGMALNITGNVSDYHGFGLYLNSCTDAAAYTGVSFNLKGNVGPSAKLNFRVQINSDTKVDVANKKGTCVVPTGMMDYEACHSPSIDLTGITTDGKTFMVNFAELTGGAPVATVMANEIVGFEWAFTWPNTAAGGAGGTGGAAGGTGGASGGTGGAAGGTGGASGGTGGASGGTGGAAGGTGGAPAAGYPVNVTIDDFMFLGGPPAGGTGGTGGGGGGGTGGAAGGSGGTGGTAGGGAGGRGGTGGTTP